MTKRFEKKLDEYYTKKILEKIIWIFKINNLDYKIKDEKDDISVGCKKRKYKEFETVIRFHKRDSLFYLIDTENTRQKINEIVGDYYKNNKD